MLYKNNETVSEKMTDRALIIALFNLVGAVMERQSRGKILLCVEDEAGNVMHLYPDTSKVTFLGVVGLQNAGHQESADRHCPVHAWPNGTQQASQLGVSRQAS